MTGKIFCVGMHKAGTTSIHAFAKAMRLKSSHTLQWSRKPLLKNFLDKYDVFSDGGNHYYAEDDEFGGNHDLRGLRNLYPDCKFVLQYREIRPWMVSKMIHAGWSAATRVEPDTGVLIHDQWKSTRTMEVLRAWIANRVKYHAAAAAYLKNFPEDVLVIDVTKDSNATLKLADFVFGPGTYETVDRLDQLDKIKNRIGRRIVPINMPRENKSKNNQADRARCSEIVNGLVDDLGFQVEQSILDLKDATEKVSA
ncbi:hypothetical protein [Novosphingobium album (ex Liu et al. 2023)]|uniref:Sulfotransferase family protein n=1 Tax=Novosphingobium album (ex Liu et al. 2023) TaxID=3031130 RepID=A0ABT5WQJ5_9SPHN|nr:hypothetical protein [Novosphingobium album (ex Liu et al. 2023)]MDE8652276.1 hypothetical protein [Novosphingobium album (ex Liu et al. 2023)]